jgi:8-oxo-dGTP diphosphatase
VAGILIQRGRVLLCRRSASRHWYPGVWDLPGGHVEANESPAAALVRELREELAVEIVEPDGNCLFRIRADDFDVKIWLMTEWAGTPANLSPDEHDDIAWFSEGEVRALSLAHSSYPSLIGDALKIANPQMGHD